MTLSNNHLRLVTGLILGAVFFTCALLGGWFAKILILALAGVGLWEFFAFFWPQTKESLCLKVLGLFFGFALILFSAKEDSYQAILVLGLSALSSMLYFLYSYGKEQNNKLFPSVMPMMFGQVYVVLPLYFALQLSFFEQVFVVLIAISTDCGAYYTGLRFGKHHIWPKVSPKKTWEGSLGGMLACLVSVLAYTLIVPFFSNLQYPWWLWLIAGFFFTVASQLGDFFESALKRSCNIKDSGTILPGHGGVLDRIDSLLFIIPCYVFFQFLLKHLNLAF